MSPKNYLAQYTYRLRLAYQLPRTDRLRRIAVARPRVNDIFISYVNHDIGFVRCLDRAIRHYGFDPWIDFDDIPQFDSFLPLNNYYEDQIRAAIRKSDVFVLVFSKTSHKCEKTMGYLQLAYRLNKLIVLLCQGELDESPDFPSYLENLTVFELESPIVDSVFERVACNIIHLQTYIRLIAHSVEWDKLGQPRQGLLTAKDLREVKRQKHWIETHKLGEYFSFGELQQTFLDAVDKAHKASEHIHTSLPDIFVSYARNNKTFVQKLSEQLKANNWIIWLDQDSIPVAADWRAEAEEAIRSAHTLIFVVCPISVMSEPCQWELRKAREYKKRIIPVISQRRYNQEAFRSIGLSEVQYISFVRDSASFKDSLDKLLKALKADLKDLKDYRKWLIKAHEWLDKGRLDRLLLNRHEFRDIQHWRQRRKVLAEQNKKALEPLLPEQIEYIKASQRFLAVQRKRQGIYLSIVLATSLGLAGLLVGKTLGEIRALVRSLDDLQGLDALVTGLKAGKRVKSSDMFVKTLRPSLRSQATTALHRTTLNLREINRLQGHDGKIFSVVFSPDSQKIVSVGADKHVRFWKLEPPLPQIALRETSGIDGQCKQSQETISEAEHTSPVVTVSYSSDGKKIATGDRSGVINLWDCNGRLDKTLSQRHQGSINRVLFSPGSQYLASASLDGQIFLWSREDDFTNLIELEHESKQPILALAFSPNGQYLAAADIDGQVFLWSLTGKLLKTFRYQGDVPASFSSVFESNSIFTMQFSPDSSLLAFAGATGVVQVQNIVKDTVRWLSDHDGGTFQISFSSDGATLASASEDGTVKLWGLRRQPGKELIYTLRGHQGPVYRVRFSPNDDVLATGGADGIVRLWLRDKGVQIDAFEGHDDEIASLDFASKPTLGYQSVLVSASDDGEIRIWNIDSPIHPLPHNSHVFDVAFRPDGRVIAAAGVHNIRLWRPNGTLRSHIAFDKAIDIQSIKYKANDVQTVDYSHEGRLLAAGGSEGEIKVWLPEVNTAEPIQVLTAHTTSRQAGAVTRGVLDLSFSPNGQWLASGGADRTLKLWKVEGDTIYRYATLKHANDVTAVAFSQDSRLLITATKAESDVNERGILIWEIPESNQLDRQPLLRSETDIGHEGSVLTVATQHRSPYLIASGGVDGRINLWDTSGTLIKTLDKHSDPVTQVTFSEDGLFLASSSMDGTVRLWTAQGELISILERHNRAVSSAEFRPGQGDLLASSSLDEDVLLWELWNLSDVELTERNQNRVILQMLIKSGCQAALPFLKAHQVPQAALKDVSTAERETTREINEVNQFCKRYL